MPDTMSAVRATVVDWLRQEEQALTRIARRRPHDPEVAERLRVWTERLQAYERLETALARRYTTPMLEQPAAPNGLTEAIKLGLRLVP